MKDEFRKATGFWQILTRPDLGDAMAASVSMGIFNIAAYVHVQGLQPVSNTYLLAEQAKVLSAGVLYTGVQYLACKAWQYSRKIFS